MGRHGMPRATSWRESLEYQLLLEEYGPEYAEGMYRKRQSERTKKQTARTKPRKPESKVVDEIMEYLKGVARVVWINHTTGLVGGDRVLNNPNKGIPDIMGLMPSGQFFAFEVKSPDVKHPPAETRNALTGLPSENWRHYICQKAWLDRLRGQGSIAEFVTSVEQVETLLGKLGHKA